MNLLSIIIPARDEEACIASTIQRLHSELQLHSISHEILVINDGSTDSTWEILESEKETISELRPIQNLGGLGLGRAISLGLDNFSGDACIIMMADQSDDPKDAVRYWQEINRPGIDCVFGSRFDKGGAVIDYPPVKFFLNRAANLFIRLLFRHGYNDTTNAFKAYRREVIEGIRPILSPHFNITVELPLKAIVRGFRFSTIPITWRNRTSGVAKLKIKEMGSRYLFICLYVWLEKYFSRGDYMKPMP